MSNMSYFRFQNTLRDLEACADAFLDLEELSQEEKEARKRLVEICRDIVMCANNLEEEDNDI